MQECLSWYLPNVYTKQVLCTLKRHSLINCALTSMSGSKVTDISLSRFSSILCINSKRSNPSKSKSCKKIITNQISVLSHVPDNERYGFHHYKYIMILNYTGHFYTSEKSLCSCNHHLKSLDYFLKTGTVDSPLTMACQLLNVCGIVPITW